MRDFRLAGVGLPAERKERFKNAMLELTQLQAKFEENVLDATNSWTRHVTDPQELRGLNEMLTEQARRRATDRGLPGWLLSLDQPTYVAVVTDAESHDLRRAFYEAWTTRASERGPDAGRWDNSGVMEEILKHRHEAARLLDFANYADYALATRMASSVAEVLSFLHELARAARAAAQAEFAELEAFAGRRLAAWDVGFYAERLQRERYSVSQEELRPYFPLPRVLAGLFEVAERLFAVRIRERVGAPVWHADARLFDIVAAGGEPVGSFYLDAYARPNKRSGAWMDECVGRKRLASGAALPVAYLVCNFLPPGVERDALLTHDDVLTLFHEFGHGLHHLLTRVDYPSIAGINGVAWDAVELPSQFLENYAWHPEVLQRISGHYQTGRAAARAAAGAAHRHAQLPRGAADGAPARVRAVRLPHPRRVLPGARRTGARDPPGGARGSRGGAGPGVEPLPEQLRSHLRRRLRGRLLQLQVGRGAGRGRLRGLRGERGVRPPHRAALPRCDPLRAAAAATRSRPSSNSAAAARTCARC